MPHGGYHGTVMMGGNVIQQGGTGKDAGKLAPKDDKGQFIPFDTPLVNMPKKGSDRQPGLFAQTPADNLATIIDQKDILKFQPSSDRPGMNAYQDAIQNFRTASPANMAAYGQRFPLTQFAMTGLPSIVKSMIPGGNVFSMIANAYQSGKERVQGGLSAVADEFSGTLSGLKSLLPTSLGGANVPDVSTPIKFVDESRPEDYPLKDMAVDQEPLSNFFKIPMYTQNYAEQQAGPNPIYVDPRNIREFLNPNKKQFNEGGLASLNNPEYGMLMKASDFSL